MDKFSKQVLFEDNHLLVLNKRAGIATMGEPEGVDTLFTEAQAYIAQKYNKPGKVYLGVVSRLDKMVSGVVIFARTSKSAQRLCAQFKGRSVNKYYSAVVEGNLGKKEADLVHYMKKNEHTHKMYTTHESTPGAQIAKLSYKVLGNCREKTLLSVRLETGRKHQIRVQLAKIGYPIFGDLKYGAEQEFGRGYGIALHARQLSLVHPTLKTEMNFSAKPPKTWNKLGFDL